MKLKWQILLIATLSLSFPWVVWQTFKSLNLTFQKNMLDAAANQAQVIVNSVQQFNQDRHQELAGLVPSMLTKDVAIDGNPIEWSEVPWYVVTQKFKFKIGFHQQELHLYVAVSDSSIYTHPTLNSDRLVIAINQARGTHKITIKRQAEGVVPKTFGQNNYQAYWHETANGYEVEVKLKTRDINRIGMVAIDHQNRETSYATGHQDNDQIQLQALFKPQSHWQNFLQQISPEDGGITLLDSQDRVFYQTQSALPDNADNNWLAELIYELAFDQSETDQNHFFGHKITQIFDAGKIELTVKHNAAQSALIQTFINSILWILMIAVVLLAGYFLIFVILAWRIRRLNKKLQTVLDDQGKIHTALPSNQAQDEIGDLSRGMSSLLAQINDYTEYLKQLGSRLSHEMKTPISIVHTSLENLQMEQPDNDFVTRALTANHRLKFILNQLSALSQLKQVITETEPKVFDLNELLFELSKGYQLQTKNIHYNGYSQPVIINGSQELVAQMIDKLIQNALDFTTKDDLIRLQLNIESEQFLLKVINTGSQIPAHNSHQLFDSLTSFRQQKDPEPHLGLGLYIAKLICDYHQATITASNLGHDTPDEPLAVEFVVRGPLIKK